MVSPVNKPLQELVLAEVWPDEFVSKNFRLSELFRSTIAARRGIDNSLPGDAELRAAVCVAREVLQPVRDRFGSFTPESVYRGQELERALKRKPWNWVSRSQHTRGEAADFEVPGVPTVDLAKWCEANLPVWDQIICECYDPREGPNSGWLHVSLKRPGTGVNRREVLSYVRLIPGGRFEYVQGIRETV